MTRHIAAISLAAGAATHAPARPNLAEPRTLKAWPVANININLATGERTATPFGARPRNGGSPLWINVNSDPCGTGGTVGLIDNPDADGDGLADIEFGGSPVECAAAQIPCEGSWRNWWGDIDAPSIIDCVVIAYAIAAPDTDTDGDSIGDGIDGYDLVITFADNDNGFGADGPGISARSCLLDLKLTDIPGALPGLPPGFMAVYTLTLDFASLAPSLIFELGDDDGVDDAGTGISGGAIYGHPTFGDRDGDGLHDFSYAMRFDQSALPVPGEGPGRTKGANGFLAVAPTGCTAQPCPQPTDPPGLVNASDLYATGPSCPPTITTYISTFFFDSWTCGDGTAFDSAYLELYASGVCRCCFEVPAGACSAADFAPPVGTLNFSDVLGFLQSFAVSGCGSDIADPVGTWNFDDVVAFLTLFAAGCP